MKKIISILLLLLLIFSLVSCSSLEKISLPEAKKITISSSESDQNITISDTKLIKQISDHIEFFEYECAFINKDNHTRYVIEWFDEGNRSLQKISICENGEGIVYNNRYFKISGNYWLDINYFDKIFDDFQGRTLYRIPPKLLLCLFGAETPEEFWSIEYPLYNTCEDFRNKAYFDEENNVLLLLTEEQKLAWLLDYDSNIEEFDAMDGVEVAEDYSQITITKPKSEMYEFIWENFNLYTPFDMVVRQIVIGKDPNTITAKIVLIDEDSGEIIYSANWPEEKIKFEW